MIYGKKEAVMTRGLAIVSMVCLHLFCKLGPGLSYQPLLWISEEKPFVYWIGFFCEICVPLYSMCAGYAQYVLYLKHKVSFKDRGKRILKIMINYWIILILFCILGLFFDKSGEIPGKWSYFLRSLVLDHSYNGAWWFLKTYIIILLIPSAVILFPVKKINGYLGIALCFVIFVLWYLWGRLVNVEGFISSTILHRLYDEVNNLVHVIPFFWIGAFLCKEDVFEKLNGLVQKIGKPKLTYAALIFAGCVLFVVVGVLEKFVLSGPAALFVFLSFNLIKKPAWLEKVFLFLGKHSTNIWLTHMFFYLYLFKDLVFKAKYPILVFLFMMALCIATSYVIQFIYEPVCKLLFERKKQKEPAAT